MNRSSTLLIVSLPVTLASPAAADSDQIGREVLPPGTRKLVVEEDDLGK